MTATDTIMITRHPALVDHAREIGLIDADTPVLAHASEDDIKGKHVIGVLPLHLAALAASVTVIPLALTPEDRGRELDIARVREIAGDPATYAVAPATIPSGEEVALRRMDPCGKGISLEILGPESLQGSGPLVFRGDLEDLGEAGHVRTFRARPRPEGPLVVVFPDQNSEAVEGAVEAVSFYVRNGGDPITVRAFFARPGARFRTYGYKGRSSTELVLDATGALRGATPAERAQGREATSLSTSLADKLKEAGIC